MSSNEETKKSLSEEELRQIGIYFADWSVKDILGNIEGKIMTFLEATVDSSRLEPTKSLIREMIWDRYRKSYYDPINNPVGFNPKDGVSYKEITGIVNRNIEKAVKSVK